MDNEISIPLICHSHLHLAKVNNSSSRSFLSSVSSSPKSSGGIVSPPLLPKQTLLASMRTNAFHGDKTCFNNCLCAASAEEKFRLSPHSTAPDSASFCDIFLFHFLVFRRHSNPHPPTVFFPCSQKQKPSRYLPRSRTQFFHVSLVGMKNVSNSCTEDRKNLQEPQKT